LPAPRRSSPATALPSRTNRPTRALRVNPSRSACSRVSFSPGQAPLLRFFPLQHTSAASRARSGGSRPPDDPAPAFHYRRARAFGREPSFGGVSPLRFFALSAGSRVATLRLADAWDRSFDLSANVFGPTCVYAAPGRAFDDREDLADPVVFAIHRAGDAGETGLLTLTTDPTNRALPLAISPPEPGHAPTRPLARCSATRGLRHFRAAQPDEGSFPQSHGKISSFPCFGLARRRSWGSTLRRFNPAYGWSRRTRAAAK